MESMARGQFLGLPKGKFLIPLFVGSIINYFCNATDVVYRGTPITLDTSQLRTMTPKTGRSY